MVARSLPPQPALPGKAARPLRHLRRRTRTPLLHPAPSSNPVTEVLELGMLVGDAGPLPHTPDCRPLRRARTPTPRREKRIFCAGFLLSWGFEEDGRGCGHGHGGGGSYHPHGEALHGSKSGRGKARWCGAGGHRELQPSHLHAQACSIQSLQKMSCSSEGSRCWVDNGYMSR